ncbi:hypothetical protein GX408_08520, partial [bacterium]|nr:hypothetical protein [bacterium]
MRDHSQKISRRSFIRQTTATGAATACLSTASAAARSTTPAQTTIQEIRSLTPHLLLNGTVAVSRPLLAPSQLSFRIGLARTRMASYPCDSMDFVMMDLERPDRRSRHAHWCTGDLSGRLLEFLCCAEGVDGKNDARLEELFQRILQQRRPSGFIGRYSASPDDPVPEQDPVRAGAASKLFHGLLRYYELTGEPRALSAAKGLAEVLWSVHEEWAKRLADPRTFGDVSQWVVEPFARLYNITKDPRWIEFCRMIRDGLQSCENRVCHSHGFLSTLRGLQELTLITGDLSWNEAVDRNYRIIVEKQFEMADGNIPEKFPHSERNEGCSIADWLMLNLNQGLIHGDDLAYDKAERIFWNALAFNQLITGGLGHRRITANGYGVDKIHEAWWCCTQNGGMAMSHYARHTVTLRQKTLQINLLTPGQFQVPLPGGGFARLRIDTAYPARPETVIEAENMPVEMPLRVRIPSCMQDANIQETRDGKRRRVLLSGKIGHRIEQCHPGVILTYGPLVLAPGRGAENKATAKDSFSEGAPAGYIPKS